MIGRIQAVILLMLPVLLIAAGCKTKVYRNQEFGIELPIPKGVFACPHPPGEHDHGLTLLLGPLFQDSCADILDSFERIRYIEIFAEYNVVESLKRLPDFLTRQCAAVSKRRWGKPPEGLKLAGLTSAAGRVDYPDGWTYIVVVTEAGAPAPGFDPRVPSRHYAITLHTNKKHFETDLVVFRKILKTIRIHPK